MSKLIIFTAPSGSGKTTIVRHLLKHIDSLAFSVSATNRPPRDHETHGKDYYFLSSEEFHWKVAQGEFLEWEMVYPGRYYGTLKAEVERLWAEGKHVIFDIEVKGATNIKKAFPEESLAVFVKVPSLEELRRRLEARGTESPEMIETRLARAAEELSYQENFDYVLINDDRDQALVEALEVVEQFLAKSPSTELK